jgi:regulator of protease activity HflC (stomatin/prohibitin superfamily)
VAVLPPESEKAAALATAADAAQALPQNVAPYLTGDGNVVLLNATLIYRINDPMAFVLSESHVAPALDRLFRATAVRVAAGRNLNDFLVVQAADQADGANGQVITALRGEVRASLLDLINARLTQLAGSGASLGVEVERIDTTAWLPPQAKSAFDSVLVATQAADRGVAVARTDAERRRQEADRERDRLLSAAQATAQETLSAASVDTVGILALEREATPQTRGSLLERVYRADVGDIMNRVGSVVLVDPQGGMRLVLPGKQK